MSLFRGQWGALPVLASGVDVPPLQSALQGAADHLAFWQRPVDQLPPDCSDGPEGRAVQPLRIKAEALGITSLLPVSIGALADRIVHQSTQDFDGDTAFVSIGGITALYRRRHSRFVLHPEWAAEPMLEPLMAFASVEISRGVCLAGQLSPVAGQGYADVVGAYARDAASAALASFAIAAACQPEQRDTKTGLVPHLDPEQTWEGLAPAARLASELRQAGTIHAAAISLRGRGRIVGSLDVDPLHRFRASVWR